MSDAEEALAFQLRAVGLPSPVREHRFAHPRRWRFDFAWPTLAVAVEVEGGQWVGGHTGNRYVSDIEKYNDAAIRGWTVLRVTPAMVEEGTAVGLIERAINSRVRPEVEREFVRRDT